MKMNTNEESDSGLLNYARSMLHILDDPIPGLFLT